MSYRVLTVDAFFIYLLGGSSTRSKGTLGGVDGALV